MAITERQEQILNTIVQEYINSVQPVSSQLLEKKYNFGISPATIRIEMQELTNTGFIFQPHTSAGRIPTDKGYRFFVDNIIESNIELPLVEAKMKKGTESSSTFKGFDDKKFFEEFEQIEKVIEDSLKFTQLLTKNLASASSNLALSYLFDKDFLWKEGWEEILGEPEFKETEYISNFAKLLKSFEENIINLEINSEIKIYIGKENPFSKARDFSTIISRCRFPKNQKGILAILGPKRMAYPRNIGLISSIVKSLEDY